MKMCISDSLSNRMRLIIIMAFGASLTQLSHLPYPKQFHCQQIRFKLCDFAIVNIVQKRNSMVSFYGVNGGVKLKIVSVCACVCVRSLYT